MLRVLLWAALLASCLWFSARALARPMSAEGECSRDPWIELTFEGGLWPPQLRSDVSEDLRVGLHLRGIGLCTSSQDAQTEPVARTILHLDGAEGLVVEVEVEDAVTDKRLVRDVDLRSVSPDAQGLALAQAVDELLRASWIELTIRDPPKTALPPPPEIRRAVEHATELPDVTSERLHVLGARFAMEGYTGGMRLLGADALIAYWFADRFGVSVMLGMRTGLRKSAQNGSVDVNALTASASLLMPIWPHVSRYNLIVSAGAHAAQLLATGNSGRDMVRTRALHSYVGVARLGLTAVWRVADLLRIELTLGPGIVLSGVVITDTGSDVVGASGFELHGALGIGGLF